ncbi:MAG TPA: PIN domain-containing protein [Paracoccaceae bacterium]|nr:PIN domain-containing protein [Paracoccaceae bacterium]
MSPPRGFLDACVLYPPLVRGCLLSAAAEGLLVPLWSPRVIEEWARASLRDHGPEGERAARAEAALMADRWPQAAAETEDAGRPTACAPEADAVGTRSAPEADERRTDGRRRADERPTKGRRKADEGPTKGAPSPDESGTDFGPAPRPETTLPDPADVHVLEAALAADADLLVTSNLKDFPAPKLRALGLAPISPDALLWELAGRRPEAAAAAIARALAPFPHLAGNPKEAARALKRAHLPRLAKLVRTGALGL